MVICIEKQQRDNTTRLCLNSVVSSRGPEDTAVWFHSRRQNQRACVPSVWTFPCSSVWYLAPPPALPFTPGPPVHHQFISTQLNTADLMHFLSHVFVCFFCSQLWLVSTISRKERTLGERGKDCEKIVWSHQSEQVHLLIYLLTLFSLSFCPALIS